jgi:phospho-N-acetylmuramoyl-pentapeptide-transferase
MLYNYLYPLAADYAALNIFKYITFRAGGAVMTAMLISFLMGPWLIRKLRAWKSAGQPIREDGPESHFRKKGTPTMGGLLILIAVTASTLLWTDIANPYVWIVLWVFLGFGAIGAADDYAKLTRSSHRGLSARFRLFLEFMIGAIAVLAVMNLTTTSLGTSLAFPFFKNLLVDLGWFFLPFGMFVIVGASNAVNLTDGLDGLAIGPIMLAAVCFGIISYLVGNALFANYLQIHFVPGTGELAVPTGARRSSAVLGVPAMRPWLAAFWASRAGLARGFSTCSTSSSRCVWPT